MANLIEIGKSGIKVPFLGMGTWAIGGKSNQGNQSRLKIMPRHWAYLWKSQILFK